VATSLLATRAYNRTPLRNARGWCLPFQPSDWIKPDSYIWYPYPFLDPDEDGGYGAVALYCLGIAVGIAVFGAIVVLLSRRGGPPAEPAPSIRSIGEPTTAEDLLTA
jgi:hypothetical protein